MPGIGALAHTQSGSSTPLGRSLRHLLLSPLMPQVSPGFPASPCPTSSQPSLPGRWGGGGGVPGFCCLPSLPVGPRGTVVELQGRLWWQLSYPGVGIVTARPGSLMGCLLVGTCLLPTLSLGMWCALVQRFKHPGRSSSCLRWGR